MSALTGGCSSFSVRTSVAHDGLPQQAVHVLDEVIARGHGFGNLRFETDKSMPEAQSLYRNLGTEGVPAFNDVPTAHHWFGKRIAGPGALHG
ncbi:MAG: hypothetical protein R3E87_17145 [Burkholderiaceae bacterium]